MMGSGFPGLGADGLGRPRSGWHIDRADRKAFWPGHLATGFGGPKVLAQVLDPTRTLTLYAGTNKGIFKSTDGGSTWTPANTGLTASGILALAVDLQTPATVYAGTDGGVFKSTNGAASWTAASTGLGAQPVSALAIDPASPSTLYAGTQTAGVFRSSDGGAELDGGQERPDSHADPLPRGRPQIAFDDLCRDECRTLQEHALLFDPASASTVYAGTNAGVFVSADNGASWGPLNVGLTNPVVNALVRAPDQAGRCTPPPTAQASSSSPVSWRIELL